MSKKPEKKAEPIPGFEVYDKYNRKLAENPIKQRRVPGRRAYDENGERIWAPDPNRKMHQYLLRVPKGQWKAFSMKCERNGVKLAPAIRALMMMWVRGEIDADLRPRIEDDKKKKADTPSV